MLFIVNLTCELGALDEVVEIPDDHLDFYADELDAGWLQPIDENGERVVEVPAE